MNNKNRSLIWVTIRMLVVGVSVFISGNTLVAQDVPVAIVGQYEDVADPNISDEFNTTVIDTDRWAYRTKNGTNWGTGSDYVYTVAQGNDQFVSIKGNWSEEKGSGLSAKRASHFGFYTMRWRTANISSAWKTPWHPAIWLAGKNFASGADARSSPPSSKRLEIDFMEFWHLPGWHSQTVAWESLPEGGFLNPRQVMREQNDDFPTVGSGWQTHGLEYHPDHVQLWQKLEGDWERIGQRILFTDGPTSNTAINKGHVAPGYWILSNKYHWAEVSAVYDDNPDLSEFRLENSWLHVDYFRYHPLSEEIEGDFNGDRRVDGLDFLQWQRGQTPNPLSYGDLNKWKNNYGHSDFPAPLITTVPECSSIQFLFVSLATASAVARWR